MMSILVPQRREPEKPEPPQRAEQEKHAGPYDLATAASNVGHHGLISLTGWEAIHVELKRLGWKLVKA